MLRKLVFLGTPHHGSPLERGGNIFQAALAVSGYSAPFARLGKIRSAGITDMRFGSLLDEDWKNCDRFALSHGKRRPVPLPELPYPVDKPGPATPEDQVEALHEQVAGRVEGGVLNEGQGTPC